MAGVVAPAEVPDAPEVRPAPAAPEAPAAATAGWLNTRPVICICRRLPENTEPAAACCTGAPGASELPAEDTLRLSTKKMRLRS